MAGKGSFEAFCVSVPLLLGVGDVVFGSILFAHFRHSSGASPSNATCAKPIPTWCLVTGILALLGALLYDLMFLITWKGKHVRSKPLIVWICLQLAWLVGFFVCVVIGTSYVLDVNQSNCSTSLGANAFLFLLFNWLLVVATLCVILIMVALKCCCLRDGETDNHYRAQH